MGTARKVMRFFNFIGGYLSFLKFLQQKSKPVDQILDTTSKLFYSNYFLLDNISWFAKTNLLSTVPLDKAEEFSIARVFNNNHAAEYATLGAKSWVVGIVFGLLYQFSTLSKRFYFQFLIYSV
jgi:hypothetical protein